MFQRLHQNSYPGRLVFSLLRRWGGVPKVEVVFKKVVPESPRLDRVVFQKLGWCSKVVPESPRLDGVLFQKLGCSKKLSQNPRSGGVPKGCARIPTARWGGVSKVGWCCKKLSQNPHSVYYYFFHDVSLCTSFSP